MTTPMYVREPALGVATVTVLNDDGSGGPFVPTAIPLGPAGSGDDDPAEPTLVESIWYCGQTLTDDTGNAQITIWLTEPGGSALMVRSYQLAAAQANLLRSGSVPVMITIPADWVLSVAILGTGLVVGVSFGVAALGGIVR